MTLGSWLRTRWLGVLLSAPSQSLRRKLAEWRRAARRSGHVVSVFLELDDPYSYVLGDYLDELARYYAIDLRLYLAEALRGEFRPAPELYYEYALNDCRQVARELGIPFLDKGETPPVEHRRALLDILAARHDSAEFPQELLEGLTAYWRGDSERVGRRCRSAGGETGANVRLDRNQALLQRLGHYNTAMICYGGEWYWGVDRLHYLVDRLDALGVRREPGLAPRIASIRQVMRPVLPVGVPEKARTLPPVELFYSLRSPYSWLAFDRIAAIADAFGAKLELRPVLPMVMRGLPVPPQKLRYMLFDAGREARRHGVPFGRFADPAGSGVERLMAVWQYAIAEQRERQFVQSAGDAIWHRGIDVATDKGLRLVTADAGLDWQGALAALGDDGWRSIAALNREAMSDAGAWGVPAIRIGDWLSWGQDRDWLVARRLEELCDNGDGILV